MKTPRKNYVGMEFGKLKVISFYEFRTMKNKRQHPYWLCRCSCGNEKIASSQSLRAGNSKSCGCLHKEAMAKRSGNKNPMSLPKGEAALNQLYSSYKGNAKSKKIVFEISKEDFCNLIVAGS